jgi:chromosome segregation ATPase
LRKNNRLVLIFTMLTKTDLNSIDRLLARRIKSSEKKLIKAINVVDDRVEALAVATKKQFDHVYEKFDQIDLRFEKIDERFEKIDERFEKIDERFEKIDLRFEEINERFEEVDEKFEKVDKQFVEIRNNLSYLNGEVDDIKRIQLSNFNQLDKNTDNIRVIKTKLKIN